jgi:DNA-binding IclR family transcriptional regulator
MAKTSGSSSQLLRGLLMIEAVAESTRRLSVTELVEVLGLPKPTVHRISTQLEEEGYLQRSPVDKRFVIGNQLKDLAFSILSNNSVGAARHAILQALSEEIGETCNCAMLDGNHSVYFDRVETNWPIKIQLHQGSQLPLHATASGKLFLAHMKPKERKRLLRAAPLSRNTERTLVSPDFLEEELKKIKEEGVGYDNEEFLTGMVAIAVPVFDKSNKVCFTVAVHAPTVRMKIDDLRQYIPSLRRAASSLASSYCSAEDQDE